MTELFKHSENYIWISIGKLLAQGKQIEWDKVFNQNRFGSYLSSVDFPSCLYYAEIMEYYPNSKVILSWREPEKWYDSFYNSIGRMAPAHPQHAWSFQIF